MVVTVDVAVGDLSVELMLEFTVGFADVVGNLLIVLVTLLLLLTRFGDAMVELSVDGGSADVLADVTGLVDVVLMELEVVDITLLLLVDDTVSSRTQGRINETKTLR